MQDLFASTTARTRTPRASTTAPAWTGQIPVPPYDRPLPREYWDGLKPPVTPPKPEVPNPSKPDRLPARFALALCALCASSLLLGQFSTKHAQQHTPDLVPPLDTPAFTRTPVHIDDPKFPSVPLPPRADPVWLPGRQYTVTIPDGRTILVNFKGWVDHACNLPRQPKGGANNAMYIESATGTGWIWTVPLGSSNVPRWIDP